MIDLDVEAPVMHVTGKTRHVAPLIPLDLALVGHAAVLGYGYAKDIFMDVGMDTKCNGGDSYHQKY